jgi:hypothetical protein
MIMTLEFTEKLTNRYSIDVDVPEGLNDEQLQTLVDKYSGLLSLVAEDKEADESQVKWTPGAFYTRDAEEADEFIIDCRLTESGVFPVVHEAGDE